MPYTDRDKQYHYPTPIQQLATTLGHPANTELLRCLEDSVRTPPYYSALGPCYGFEQQQRRERASRNRTAVCYYI